MEENKKDFTDNYLDNQRWGSTKFGSCDDILYIVKKLREEKRTFYLHVDAALYGGIPNNQKNAPVITNINEMKVDSISVSLHKYIGVSSVKSVLLAVRKPKAEVVSYIGMQDSTTAGSRDILPFTMRQQIFDVLYLSNENEYSKNIILFESLLKQKNISYVRSGLGNIFVINRPPDSICKKYQLSTFEICDSGEAIKKAHIIIFPYQSQSVINELACELAEFT